jgi:putative PIG3 family NAD(P)H quinone oxidoreductase
MRAMVLIGTGEHAVLQMQEQPTPTPGPQDLLVRVKAAGVNRADLLQRKGLYPPPAGESSILGLEIAGEVVAVGSGVKNFAEGERVFGLVGGGGYAEYCLLDAGLAIKTPGQFDDVQAAAIPEAYLAANETLFEYGKLAAGETLLIHAGGSGVSTAAMQMALHQGAQVFFTTSMEEKILRVQQLLQSDARGISYKSKDFEIEVMRETQDKGVDLIIDFIGAPYLEKHLRLLKTKGRLLQVAVMGGYLGEINLATVLKKRLSIIGFAMRHQSLADKREIMQRFLKNQWPLFLSGVLKPVVDCTFALEDAAEAHEYMQQNKNVGKVTLRVC